MKNALYYRLEFTNQQTGERFYFVRSGETHCTRAFPGGIVLIAATTPHYEKAQMFSSLAEASKIWTEAKNPANWKIVDSMGNYYDL